MFLHSMKFVQFHRLVKNPHQVNKMQSNHISINNVWLWFLICKLFNGSNNEFLILTFELNNQSTVLFFYLLLFSLSRQLWLVKLKLKICFCIWWTAFNDFIFPKYCTEWICAYQSHLFPSQTNKTALLMYFRIKIYWNKNSLSKEEMMKDFLHIKNLLFE